MGHIFNLRNQLKSINKKAVIIYHNIDQKPIISIFLKTKWSLFVKAWVHFTQGCFVPSLVKIGPVVPEKKMKMWNVYRQTDRQTDGRTDGQIERQTETDTDKGTDWQTDGQTDGQKTSLVLSAQVI